MPRTRSDLAQSPLRVARQHLGLSLSDFAEVCKVHEQALYLNECGCFKGVLPAVEGVLNGLGFDVKLLESEYRFFQQSQRTEFGRIHEFSTRTLAELGRHRLDRSPITTFRERIKLSQLALAKGLCVQPAILYKCEKGRAAGLPEQLGESLKECSLRASLIQELEDRQMEFHDYIMHTAKKTA